MVFTLNILLKIKLDVLRAYIKYKYNRKEYLEKFKSTILNCF